MRIKATSNLCRLGIARRIARAESINTVASRETAETLRHRYLWRIVKRVNNPAASRVT